MSMRIWSLCLCLMMSTTALLGCENCGGPSSGGEGEGEGESAEGEGDGAEGEGEGEPSCGPETPGFGTACTNDVDPQAPRCGFLICDPDSGELTCADPGPNPCGACQPQGTEFNTEAGRLESVCGEFGCGIAVCALDALGTTCIGDHERNICGGCGFLVDGEVPGQSCSVCDTGVRYCSTDMDELICWQGRQPDSSCGGCGRCTLSHARMDDRYNGDYIRAGTVAIIDDVGGGDFAPLSLVFDPLIEGDGLRGLPGANVVLSESSDLSFGATVTLFPFVSGAPDVLSDPHRIYDVPSFLQIDQFRYVLIVENTPPFFNSTIISVGEIVAGAPTVVGEGEGEGEGEPVGEGEGEPVGEGEGEGDGGEGEGEAPPTDTDGDGVPDSTDADRNNACVPAANNAVCGGIGTDQLTYLRPTLITVIHSLPSAAGDWLSLAALGAAPSAYVAWTTPDGDNTVTFDSTALAPGLYVARSHINNVDTVVDESLPFQVN
jgi:hypothetical protein